MAYTCASYHQMGVCIHESMVRGRQTTHLLNQFHSLSSKVNMKQSIQTNSLTTFKVDYEYVDGFLTMEGTKHTQHLLTY